MKQSKQNEKAFWGIIPKVQLTSKSELKGEIKNGIYY